MPCVAVNKRTLDITPKTIGESHPCHWVGLLDSEALLYFGQTFLVHDGQGVVHLVDQNGLLNSVIYDQLPQHKRMVDLYGFSVDWIDAEGLTFNALKTVMNLPSGSLWKNAKLTLDPIKMGQTLRR